MLIDVYGLISWSPQSSVLRFAFFSFGKTEIETIVHVIAGKDFQTADLPAASHTPSSTGVHFHFR